MNGHEAAESEGKLRPTALFAAIPDEDGATVRSVWSADVWKNL